MGGIARRRRARMVAGALTCVALAACGGASATQSAPTPDRQVIDTTTFAPRLHVNLARFTRTRLGAYYLDVRPGTGALAAAERTLRVKYTISLPDGTVVDVQNTPMDLVLGSGMIRGLREGLSGMRVGGLRTIVVPPSLGYGDRAYGSIPPRSTLVCEFELLDVR